MGGRHQIGIWTGDVYIQHVFDGSKWNWTICKYLWDISHVVVAMTACQRWDEGCKKRQEGVTVELTKEKALHVTSAHYSFML